MPRIPMLELPAMNAAQRRVYDDVVSGPRGSMVGPLRAALHNPQLADKWQQFGEQVRYHTSLDTRHSELAILVTARAWSCSFEWYQHAPIALRSGLPAAVVEAIRVGQRPVFDNDTDQIIFDYVDELQTRRTVGAATHETAVGVCGVVGVVELTAIVGYYTLVAMTLNAHAFELPEDAADPFKEPDA